MYLLGHTDPTLTMRVYQQVLDMGGAAVETLERVLGCTLQGALGIYSGREGLWTQSEPGAKTSSVDRSQRGRQDAIWGSVEPDPAKRLKGFEPSTFCMASSSSTPEIVAKCLQISRYQ
jgi:hypothetical protein